MAFRNKMASLELDPKIHQKSSGYTPAEQRVQLDPSSLWHRLTDRMTETPTAAGSAGSEPTPNGTNDPRTNGEGSPTETLSTDHVVADTIGHRFIITNRLLGHGSYGDVFLATDEHNNQLAVKKCPLDKTGIPNILEASIMSSMAHPYLNRALRIEASASKLYIFQDLAEADLSQRTRRDKGNHKPSLEELRRWCFCLAHAVHELHKNSIIHADIKASNVLIYPDGSVRLTDYTLATKKWSPTQKFTHNVCTCTHRPLECLLRRPWDEALDLWSLGCTFYEIAYGELLFPYQGVLESNQKAKDREAKARLRDRSINAIIDWSARGPNPPTSFEVIGVSQMPIDYLQYALCEDYTKAEMNSFNDLVCKMLMVDPSQRLNIREVLAHPFFEGLKAPVYLSIQRPLNKISVAEQARVTRYIQRYSADANVQGLALNIYRRCNDLGHISEQIRSAACTWIAAKIVIGYPPTIGLPPHQILGTEREICHNLVFRLHVL